MEIVFEWDEEKRQKILMERGLDMVILAPIMLDDPNVGGTIWQKK